MVRRGKRRLKRGRNWGDRDQSSSTSKITFISLNINSYRPKLGALH